MKLHVKLLTVLAFLASAAAYTPRAPPPVARSRGRPGAATMCALEPTAQGRVVPTAAPQIAQPPPPPEPWLPPPAAPSSGAPSKPDGAIMRDSQMEELLTELKLNSRQPKTLPTRGVFATRALDLRQIKCIGYDMDYTLIDYKMVLWEERAYHYSKEHLRSKGFPVSGLRFDPELVCRGLVIDKQSGNMVKVDRFGYVRRAMHGTRRLSVAERHSEYGRLTVDLRESRWAFLNTLFSVSEGCLYAQLVDRLDSDDWLDSCAPPFDEERCRTYEQLHKAVTKALFRAHVQSQLKDEVMSDPGRFMNTDPAFTQTLLEQRCAERASDTRLPPQPRRPTARSHIPRSSLPLCAATPVRSSRSSQTRTGCTRRHSCSSRTRPSSRRGCRGSSSST